MSPSHEKLANLEAFLRCVIEDCKAGTASVGAGVGAIAMLIEAVDARDWDSVAIWMQALRRIDPSGEKPANAQEVDVVHPTIDATSACVH